MTPRKTSAAPATNQRSILIVDDDVAATESLTDILCGEGYQVATARNGKEALSHLRNATLPRLIILDLFMPEMDGWEFRREQLKDNALSGIPVVVMTGASVYAGIDANIIVHKPLDVARFVSIIERYF
ncbi:MAG TPA: response regulator [Candidatus Binataceae bacterium]|nr:response regulator [Candidatus Binataceae bacterium]